MTKIKQISTEKNSFLKDLEKDSLQSFSGQFCFNFEWRGFFFKWFSLQGSYPTWKIVEFDMKNWNL